MTVLNSHAMWDGDDHRKGKKRSEWIVPLSGLTAITLRLNRRDHV